MSDQGDAATGVMDGERTLRSESATTTGNGNEMTAMFAAFLEDSRRRDRALQVQQRQFEQLLQMMAGQTASATAAQQASTAALMRQKPKLVKLEATDDIEAFLVTFERVMTSCHVARGEWTTHLAPNLSGKAQQAYAALDATDAVNYDRVKESVLRRYDINKETYRKRFRAAQCKEEETALDVRTRLVDLVTKWTKDATSRADLLDLIVGEQLLNVLPKEVEMHVRERNPATSDEVAQYADSYCTAHGLSLVKKTCAKCGRHNHQTVDCRADQRVAATARDVTSGEEIQAVRRTSEGGGEEVSQTSQEIRRKRAELFSAMPVARRVTLHGSVPG